MRRVSSIFCYTKGKLSSAKLDVSAFRDRGWFVWQKWSQILVLWFEKNFCVHLVKLGKIAPIIVIVTRSYMHQTKQSCNSAVENVIFSRLIFVYFLVPHIVEAFNFVGI